jgi:hypothetical protein
MRRYPYLFINLWLAFLATDCACATPTPQQFFPHNYANDGFQKDTPVATPKNDLARQGSASPLPASPSNANSTPAAIEIPKAILTGDPAIDAMIKKALSKAQVKGEPLNQPDLNSPPPTTIIVYVNSLDREHFNRLANAVIRVNGSDSPRVLAVLQMGDWRNITQQQEEALNSAGAFVHPIAYLPEQLVGLPSPIWEVRSGNKTAYLSGVFDVARFFAPNGEIKLNKDTDQVTEPNLRLDGF